MASKKRKQMLNEGLDPDQRKRDGNPRQTVESISSSHPWIRNSSPDPFHSKKEFVSFHVRFRFSIFRATGRASNGFRIHIASINWADGFYQEKNHILRWEMQIYLQSILWLAHIWSIYNCPSCRVFHLAGLILISSRPTRRGAPWQTNAITIVWLRRSTISIRWPRPAPCGRRNFHLVQPIFIVGLFAFIHSTQPTASTQVYFIY